MVLLPPIGRGSRRARQAPPSRKPGAAGSRPASPRLRTTRNGSATQQTTSPACNLHTNHTGTRIHVFWPTTRRAFPSRPEQCTAALAVDPTTRRRSSAAIIDGNSPHESPRGEIRAHNRAPKQRAEHLAFSDIQPPAASLIVSAGFSVIGTTSQFQPSLVCFHTARGFAARKKAIQSIASFCSRLRRSPKAPCLLPATESNGLSFAAPR